LSKLKEDLFLTANVTQPYRRSFSIQLAEHRGILVIVDGILVFVALLLGLWVGANRSDWIFSLELILTYLPWFLGLMALYFILAISNDAYRPKVAANPVAAFVALVKTIGLIFIIYLLIYSLSPPNSLPRHFVGIFTLVSPFLLLGWRQLYSWAFAMPVFQRKAIVVGAGWAGSTIVKTVQDFAPSHFQIIGFVDDDPAKQRAVKYEVPVIGPISALPGLAQAKRATDVVLAISRDIPGNVLTSLMECYEQGLRISTMSDLYEQLTNRVPVEYIGDNWFVVLPLNNNGQNLSYRLIKRVFDIFISIVGLSLFAILFPFVALIMIIDSPGSIFYRQKRVGRAGTEFELIKLRSMIVAAEQDGEVKWAEKDDARVTHVGRFLRSTRFDEVPQLINVLRGEMSLIGPRPERPEFVTQLQQEIPFYRTRLTIKPGLTGWAQVNYDYGRSTVDALEKLRYDLYYIKHQSIQLDLVILLKTIGTILLLKGV
jgi:exopolysaccharide biosynthesis polyprenyl glycosylphosphotransferase